MKKIIIIILIAFILIGCGTIKKSSSVIEENKTTETDITKFSNSFTLEPVNLDKPIQYRVFKSLIKPQRFGLCRTCAKQYRVFKSLIKPQRY